MLFRWLTARRARSRQIDLRVRDPSGPFRTFPWTALGVEVKRREQEIVHRTTETAINSFEQGRRKNDNVF